MSRIILANNSNRAEGVKSVIAAWGENPVSGKNVLIKPNFNTADPAPGSTHNDTLLALVDEIWRMGAKSVSVGERSYPPTVQVMDQKGIIKPLLKKDVKIINFDDLPKNDWVDAAPAESHWPDGFRVARPILEAECLVETCCVKTHQFGGVITMSLKLAVGVVPTGRQGFDYMSHLHGSPHQRKMIAEINAAFSPDLIVMDGVEAFVDGGPATGQRARGDVMLAGSDRVAMDAVGTACLKRLGANNAIMNTPIFKQEQIARAIELGLGASGPGEVDVVAADDASAAYAAEIKGILNQG